MSWGECPVHLVFERIVRHREGWPSGFLGAAHEPKVRRVTVSIRATDGCCESDSRCAA